MNKDNKCIIRYTYCLLVFKFVFCGYIFTVEEIVKVILKSFLLIENLVNLIGINIFQYLLFFLLLLFYFIKVEKYIIRYLS